MGEINHMIPTLRKKRGMEMYWEGRGGRETEKMGRREKKVI